MRRPFGYSLMIDMYGCDDFALDDLETHYRTLEELVYRLGMTPMAPPMVIHGPVKFEGDGYIDCDGNLQYYRRELFPDKFGVSGWQPLVESGIQIHSCVPTKFSTIDIYSCNDFRNNINDLKDFLKLKFRFNNYEEHLVIRGSLYGET